MTRFRVTWSRQEIILALWLWLPLCAGLAVLAWVSRAFKIPLWKFTRDPVQIFNGNPWDGVLSNIGVILWCVAAVVCFFSYVILRAIDADRSKQRFLLCCGAISTLLLLDDLFLLHERVFPLLFGISEKVVYGSYAVLVAIVFWRDRHHLSQENGLLVSALLFFAASIAVDAFPKWLGIWHHLAEDGTKILGIISWSGFFFSFCLRSVRSGLMRT